MRDAIYDASFCAALIFTEAHSEKAKHLLGIYRNGHAPVLWHYEISHILVKRVNDGVFAQADIAHGQHFFTALDIAFHENEDICTLTDIALTYNLSGYDAAYLHLAKRMHLPLLTFDKKLAEAAKKAGLPPIDV
ncbi:MAG: type II toxin-antitoxin system VapC family toxin [Bdellovibrionales bacterium]